MCGVKEVEVFQGTHERELCTLSRHTLEGEGGDFCMEHNDLMMLGRD
jgi:hypothetical protein